MKPGTTLRCLTGDRFNVFAGENYTFEQIVWTERGIRLLKLVGVDAWLGEWRFTAAVPTSEWRRPPPDPEPTPEEMARFEAARERAEAAAKKEKRQRSLV